jgi:hypothetical protein
VTELALDYGRRPEGSQSKLSTFKDGAKILWMFAMLMKETRPFMFFSYISVFTLATSMMFMVPVLNEYFLTGLVTRMPTWMLAMALMMMALMIFAAGVILDSVARGRAEQKRFHYMSIAPTRTAPTRTAEPDTRTAQVENLARTAESRKLAS